VIANDPMQELTHRRGSVGDVMVDAMPDESEEAFWARLRARAVEMGERYFCVGTSDCSGEGLDRYRVDESVRSVEISEIRTIPPRFRYSEKASLS
jgi:hypothetical protein